ncbi:hypothetical protein CYY_000778 [Polysphondylium violaceum]|uniref:Uncharacterized protein n=1 Tax=Polysphondylium violaceum TaxID=133409 RepID=A0A8J4Q260_9MYCE|nr:hypothetical protein CYY_000778 [Polysphondylium violaceum]
MAKGDSTAVDTVFYSVFRNIYIKRRIRNCRFRDSVLRVTLDYLNSNNNHVYLSRFVNSDKVDNNIRIKVVIQNTKQFRQYLRSPHREIIDDLCIESYVSTTPPPPSLNGEIEEEEKEKEKEEEIEQEQEQESEEMFQHEDQELNPMSYDLDLFHHGLRRLELAYQRNVTHWSGALPSTLLELEITHPGYRQFKSEFIDHLVSHLPPNLTRLTLPPMYNISVECRAPESLIDLDYISQVNTLCHFVLPPNRVYQNLTLRASNRQHCEWLAAHPLITSVFMYGPDFEPNIIPNHILSITMGSQRSSDNLILHKKCGIFHNALQTLDINSSCESILGIGVLPPNLTFLHLFHYNQPLQAGVLPQGLKTLVLSSFDNTIEPQSVPSSLTRLELRSYCGSFESVGPLNCLKKLNIYEIEPSASILLANVYSIVLIFMEIDPLATLFDTSIQEIECESIIDNTLPIGFLPLSIRKLFLRNLFVTEQGSIPDGCIVVDTDLPIDKSLLPPSVTIFHNN